MRRLSTWVLLLGLVPVAPAPAARAAGAEPDSPGAQATAPSSPGGAPTAASPARERFVNGGFAPIRHLGELPPSVRTALEPILAGRPLGERSTLDPATGVYKATPGNRFLFGGKAETLWFVCLELAGTELSQHLAILTVPAKGPAKVEDHLVLKKRAWSTPQVQNLVRQGQFTEAAANAG